MSINSISPQIEAFKVTDGGILQRLPEGVCLVDGVLPVLEDEVPDGAGYEVVDATSRVTHRGRIIDINWLVVFEKTPSSPKYFTDLTVAYVGFLKRLELDLNQKSGSYSSQQLAKIQGNFNKIVRNFETRMRRAETQLTQGQSLAKCQELQWISKVIDCAVREKALLMQTRLSSCASLSKPTYYFIVNPSSSSSIQMVAHVAQTLPTLASSSSKPLAQVSPMSPSVSSSSSFPPVEINPQIEAFEVSGNAVLPHLPNGICLVDEVLPVLAGEVPDGFTIK